MCWSIPLDLQTKKAKLIIENNVFAYLKMNKGFV